MQVSAFLIQIQLCLISHEEFVTTILSTDGRGVNLVAISQMDTMKIATYQHSYRVCWTLRKSCVHHLFIVFILQPTSSVSSPSRSISTSQHRCLYF